MNFNSRGLISGCYVVNTRYELVRSRGYCRPALPKGRKHLMVKTQTRQFDRCYKLICNHLTRKNAIVQLVMEVILTFLLNHKETSTNDVSSEGSPPKPDERSSQKSLKADNNMYLVSSKPTVKAQFM